VTTKQVDDALATIEGLWDYQLEQRSRSIYILKLAVLADPKPITRRCLEVLRSLYGSQATVMLEVCPDIMPGASGKYRRTQSDFDFDSKELLA
jgi:hypothetical protein